MGAGVVAAVGLTRGRGRVTSDRIRCCGSARSGTNRRFCRSLVCRPLPLDLGQSSDLGLSSDLGETFPFQLLEPGQLDIEVRPRRGQRFEFDVLRLTGLVETRIDEIEISQHDAVLLECIDIDAEGRFAQRLASEGGRQIGAVEQSRRVIGPSETVDGGDGDLIGERTEFLDENRARRLGFGDLGLEFAECNLGVIDVPGEDQRPRSGLLETRCLLSVDGNGCQSGNRHGGNRHGDDRSTERSQLTEQTTEREHGRRR